MGVVLQCLSFPIRRRGSVGRKARVGASPFPPPSPGTCPGHLDACGVASVGSEDGLCPPSCFTGRDRNQHPNEPFFHQTWQKGLALSPCLVPRGVGSEGVVPAYPPRCPRSPRHPLPPRHHGIPSPQGTVTEPSRRGWNKHCSALPSHPTHPASAGAMPSRCAVLSCHAIPAHHAMLPCHPSPPCCTIPAHRAVLQSPSRNPTRIHRELGKSGRGRGSAFSPAQHGLS